MVKGKNHLTTDAVREVKFTFGRFLSILVLSALAVAFMTGLRASAPDMRYTADRYYDRTHLMDGYVLSTMGLTEDDLEALAAADGVADVEGSRSVDAISTDAIVSVQSMPERLNLLELEEGRLPTAADECVTENILLIELGLELGDTLELTLDPDHEDDLARTEYTIVGVARSPLYISTSRGSSSLGSGSVDAFVFIPGENFTYDYYTAAYLSGDGLLELDSYSNEYEERMEALIDSLEELGTERARLRGESLTGEARRELDKGWQEYRDGLKEYEEGLTKYEDALREYNEARTKYEDGLREHSDGLARYNAGLAQYRTAEAQLNAAEEEYRAGLAEYETGKAEYEGAQAEFDRQYAAFEEAKAAGILSDEYIATQEPVLEAARVQLEGTRAQLAETAVRLDGAAQELSAGHAQLSASWTQLSTARRELDVAQVELSEALAQLEGGEAGLAEARDQLKRGKEELDDALSTLNDAQRELDEAEECVWYVLGRNTNAGFASFIQDTERISNLATIFPIIFFLVAALTCLTTMTRMVEEQRTQIGALKAMGFSRLAISKKYLGYALIASLTGGLLGLAVGGTLIPVVIASAFQIMYRIPALEFKRQTLLCVLSVLAAVGCTTGAALWACLSTLLDTPANLMRPKAPKAGRRVFLEYIKPVWNRLTFTWKVTMRNLFRYQRRFWMTVIGIGGCTALIVTGFGLHQSIFEILNLQFDEISGYDATVSLSENMSSGELAAVADYLEQNNIVSDYLFSYQSAVEVSTDGASYAATLSVVKDQAEFARFIDLRHRKDDVEVTVPADGVIISEKLSELLGVKVGDTVTIEGDHRVTAPIGDIVENYVYHYVYLTGGYYTQLFGGQHQDNVVMVCYDGEAGAAESERLSAGLMELDGVTSYSYIATIRDAFTDSMNAINYAVVIIIVAAAVLAFVVLYNLTNISITERIRELATLKVLGFYDRETTAYVYRENMFLTLFGIVLGLALGRLFHIWMVVTVEASIVMFGRTTPLYAYVLAAVLTVVFSVMVNISAHFRLKKVDMVESLKSVE